MLRPNTFLFMTLLGLGLVACSGSATPQMIASFPASTPYPPAAGYPSILYENYLEVYVADVPDAAERAKRIANDNGGYLIQAESWHRNGCLYVLLGFVVPATRFEYIHKAFSGLGSVAREEVYGGQSASVVDDFPVPPDGKASYRITLKLRPYSYALPGSALHSPRWDPFRTLSSAFGVTRAIFSFLVDVLIWITVTAGPFVLAGWGAWCLIRRWRTGRP